MPKYLGLPRYCQNRPLERKRHGMVSEFSLGSTTVLIMLSTGTKYFILHTSSKHYNIITYIFLFSYLQPLYLIPR